MRQATLSGIVRRHFVYCVNVRHQTVRDVVESIGIAPRDLCRVIAKQKSDFLPLTTYAQLAGWLRMPLANVVVLAGTRPKLDDLIGLGMEVRGFCPTRTADQIAAAHEIGIGVAVFRRALHGYSDFKPSVRTCDRLADWLAWTGFEMDDIAMAAGMIVRHRSDGRPITLASKVYYEIRPYPCACGRAGCVVPPHIPGGPRRKWRSDACRMWAKRKSDCEPGLHAPTDLGFSPPLPHHTPLVRFIMINERPVPVRF